MPNKYAKIVQDELDLHQFTRGQAEQAIKDFLERSESAGYTLVRIITGKGIHSSDGPVLWNFVRDLLHKSGYDFSNAKLNEGAIDVKININ